MVMSKAITVAVIVATSAMALECADGADKETYDKGYVQGQADYEAAWGNVHNKCSSVDEIYEQIKEAGPGKSATPCQVKGFNTGLEEMNAGYHEECPETPEGCSNVDTYAASMKQAEIQWDSSFDFVGCKGIDKVMQITSESGPTEPPCAQMGFQDQLYLSYTAAGETCGGTTCQSRGEDMAKEHWETTVQNVGSTCATADQVLTQSLAIAPPTPECLNEAYNNQIQVLYKEKFDDCMAECEGNGKEYGERLGGQFCSLTSLYSDDEGDSLIIAICDEAEKNACEFELEGYVLENCQENYEDNRNDQYYQDLKAGCAITIGPDQPTTTATPTPKPSKTPAPCDSTDGKALGEDAWTAARRQVGDTCHDIDMAFTTVTKDAPSSDDECLRNSYLDAASDLYEQAQETCINECEGYGETRGQNAADQFCRVTELYADDEGETIEVCNEKEKRACYAAFHKKIEENSKCTETVENADEKTEEFYNSVQEVCEIAIGPDQ